MAAPKLRFKEFDGDWVKTNFGKVASHISYGLTVRPEYIENGIKLISAREISTGNIDFDNAPKISISDFMLLSDKAKPQKYDLFLSKTGSIGFTSIVETDEKFAITQNIANIRLNNLSEQDPYFFLQQMRTTSFQLKAISVVNQSTIMDLQLGDIKKLEIGYPSKEEQTKIASFLSNVDEKISQLTQKHALLSQYKQGMMQKLFSQQIRFKADDGSEFGEWEEKELHQIFQIKAGGDIEKSSVSEVRTSEFSYPIFANSDKNKGFYGWANKFKYKEAVTVTGRGNLGIAVARNEPFYPIVRLLVLLPLVKQNLKFFEEQINLLDIVSESTGVPQLTAPQLSKYKVNVPSLEEQTKIANFISAIDQKIEVVAQQIEQAKTWKKGLLQQMFM
ncbi:restriction endonuclease subunit S (plasmid) [Acinetobacter pseudolwoffii]|nr:restriction endonuclease subunit S [Acinetobacter pseudolwoffii]MDH5821215.1 restriction endonuclease subunit S [Acinetobacter pseudolwoffii]